MSKDKVSGPIMGVTDGDICQPILLTPDGEAIFHKEEEMLARLAKVEGQVKSWVDGLLDLHERVRRLDDLVGLERNRLTNLETRVKEIPKAIGEELHPLVGKVEKLIEFVDMKDRVRKKDNERLEERVGSMEELIRKATLQQVSDAVAKGDWHVPGTEDA